ncbi:thioredoxin-like protein [Fusarium solani]|uniref:Thioredoxin-like protein n=2 Tax=Fusarium solani species complex TaxID=232080 RepID=A0A9P9RAD3_FUSSL|nr:thioredoxin-like protein [Fusarium solani]KAH7271539.1 thioredoxin-like protein [Fusarium solani]
MHTVHFMQPFPPVTLFRPKSLIRHPCQPQARNYLAVELVRSSAASLNNPTKTTPTTTPAMTAAKYAFTKSLREVRFLFCQTSEQSAAVRSFITRAYPTMKRSNPNIPILIREAAGTQPKVYARYERGTEKSKVLEGLSDKEIEDAVSGLVQPTQ